MSHRPLDDKGVNELFKKAKEIAEKIICIRVHYRRYWAGILT